jgi:hypothetical protein
MLEGQAEEVVATLEAEVKSLPLAEQPAFMAVVKEHRRRLAVIRKLRL